MLNDKWAVKTGGAFSNDGVDNFYVKQAGAFTPVFPLTGGDFVTTWKTDNSGVSSSTQISLPLISTGTYDFVVDWGDNTTDTIAAWDQSEKTHTYDEAGTYTVSISGTCVGFRFNSGGDRLKIISIESWGNLGLVGTFAFAGCEKMAMNATDAPDLSNTTTLSGAFYNSSYGSLGAAFVESTGTFENWDTSGITDMTYLFYGAMRNPSGIESWDVSSVTTFEWFSYRDVGWYEESQFSPDLSNWNVGNCVNFGRMFQHQTSVDFDAANWDTSSARFMYLMFTGSGFPALWLPEAYYSRFSGIGIENWDVSNVENMYAMFARNDVINVDLSPWDVSSVTEYGEFDVETPNWTAPKPNFT